MVVLGLRRTVWAKRIGRAKRKETGSCKYWTERMTFHVPLVCATRSWKIIQPEPEPEPPGQTVRKIKSRTPEAVNSLKRIKICIWCCVLCCAVIVLLCAVLCCTLRPPYTVPWICFDYLSYSLLSLSRLSPISTVSKLTDLITTVIQASTRISLSAEIV